MYQLCHKTTKDEVGEMIGKGYLTQDKRNKVNYNIVDVNVMLLFLYNKITQ